MIVSKVFVLSRTQMARIASEEYVRMYWWFVAPLPVVGLTAVLMTTGPMQALGMLALLWPFSIPARSVLITSKPSRLFTGGCHIEANSTEVAFIAEPRDGKRLRNIISLNNVRQAVRRNGVILLRMRLPGMAPIREDAFESEEQLQAFLKLVQDAVDSRLNGGSSVTQA